MIAGHDLPAHHQRPQHLLLPQNLAQMSQLVHHYVGAPARHSQAQHQRQHMTLSLLLRWWQGGRVYLNPSLRWVCCGGRSWTFEGQLREGGMPEE